PAGMVGREGFEPPKAFRQLIYSQPPLAAWVPPRSSPSVGGNPLAVNRGQSTRSGTARTSRLALLCTRRKPGEHLVRHKMNSVQASLVEELEHEALDPLRRELAHLTGDLIRRAHEPSVLFERGRQLRRGRRCPRGQVSLDLTGAAFQRRPIFSDQKSTHPRMAD